MSTSSGKELNGENPRDLKTHHNQSHNPALANQRMEAFVRSLARQSAEQDFRISQKPKTPE